MSFALTPFTRNDPKAADGIVSLAGKGDLVLRDLGYFTTESLRQLALNGAHFISRYRYGTNLYDVDGNKIELLQRLQKHGVLDIDILLGNTMRLPTRLLASGYPHRWPTSEGESFAKTAIVDSIQAKSIWL